MNDDLHHLEKAFRHKERKENRQQRQISSAKDRSKFKKTDQRQKKKRDQANAERKLQNPHLKRGRVVAIRSEGIIVSYENTPYQCVLRGILKKEVHRNKNIVTVGDWVFFEEVSSGEGAIEHIEERTSTLARAENLWQKQRQLIAANIDQVLITMSVVIPPLKPPLIDRYIIASLKGNMKPILVINKTDLLDENPDEKAYYDDCLEAYKNAGIQILSVSASKNEGIDSLKELMKDRSSVFAGQSGVGKSSLINLLAGLELATGDTIDKTKKGAHTTTSAELLPLPFGGWCIDTPGIKSFGMWDLDKDDIKNYYPEFSDSACRFPNCSHIHEPDCSVIQAVEEGVIHPMRYQSYCSLYAQLEEEHRPR